MTLVQFGYLAVGVALGYLFFKILPLPTAVNFGVGMLFAGGGAALAFVPIQGRPLDVWLRAFIKSVYSPTQYFWRKDNAPPIFFTQSFLKRKTKETSLLQKHQEAKEKLNTYLQSLKPVEYEVLDEAEKKALSKISPLFAQKGFLPKAPSFVSGLVKAQNFALPNVIINIKSENGDIVRILKTDKQGRFSLNIPLKQGNYIVEVEDPNKKYAFDKFNFKINGQAFKPWLITPKG